MSAHFSFEVVNALDYDELRPDYAPRAVAWVAERGSLAPGSLVVDLAAGTGQLSRRFMLLGIDVVAVEPAANMRAVLEERLPAVRVVKGTAESIPVEDGSVEAVVVGNAFHHFDRQRAFAEIARVLRPGKALALFWAWPLEEESLRYPGLRELDEVVESTRESCQIATVYLQLDVVGVAKGQSEPASMRVVLGRPDLLAPISRRRCASTSSSDAVSTPKLHAAYKQLTAPE
jgi:SAM-dependent methyltransferase